MKETIYGALLSCCLIFAQGNASAQGLTIDELAGDNANKRLVLEYLEMAFTQRKLAEARAKYFAPDFRNFPDYRNSSVEPAPPPGVQPALPEGLTVRYEFYQAIAEGDIVVVHSMVRSNAPGIGEPVVDVMGRVGGPKVGDDVVDIFRVRDGKIVAKSDTVQASDTDDLFIR